LEAAAYLELENYRQFLSQEFQERASMSVLFGLKLCKFHTEISKVYVSISIKWAYDKI